jgi:hypothetical protein
MTHCAREKPFSMTRFSPLSKLMTEGFCWVAVKRKNEKLENLMGGNMLKKTVTIFPLNRGKSRRKTSKTTT